jgi:hypothetical protein
LKQKGAAKSKNQGCPNKKQHRLKAAVAKPPLGFATFCFRKASSKTSSNLDPLGAILRLEKQKEGSGYLW